MFRAAQLVLEEFGGLVITNDMRPGVSRGRSDCSFDPMVAIHDLDMFWAFSEGTGECSLFPLGHVFRQHGYLCIRQGGDVYSISMVEESLDFVGEDIYVAIDNIIQGRLLAWCVDGRTVDFSFPVSLRQACVKTPLVTVRQREPSG